MTELAERPDVGPEVLGHAGSLDGAPHRRGPPLLSAQGLRCGDGRDDERVAQMEQAHLGRRPAQDPLAQQRVGLDAAHTPVLVALRGRPPGLVVDHGQRTVGADVEAVDDAPQPHPVLLDLHPELHPDRLDGGGVFNDGSSCRSACRRRPRRRRRPPCSSPRATNSGSVASSFQARANSWAAAAGVRAAGRDGSKRALRGRRAPACP